MLTMLSRDCKGAVCPRTTTVFPRVSSFAVLALVLPLAGAPLSLRLEQAASRAGSDFVPAYAGKTVAVKGLVCSRPISFLDYQHLPIQDSGYGLVLEGPTGTFDKLTPGDEIEAVGRIASRAGMVILLPSDAPRILFHGAAPPPETVEREKLRSTRYLGRLVTTEGRVADMGESTGGAYLIIGDSRNSYKLFVPFSRQSPAAAFPGINTGDLVRATGIASQYCPIAPYNRWFEMVMPSSVSVVRIAGGWLLDPLLLGSALVLCLLVGLIWWSRERRMRAQREMLGAVHELGEEIPGLASAAEILKRISSALPRLFRISRVRLYVHSRGSKTLDEVLADPKSHPVSVSPGRSRRRHRGGRGGVLPKPYPTGGARFFAQPVRGTHDESGRPLAAIAAVRAHVRAGRGDRRHRNRPGPGQPHLHRRRADAGAAPGESDRPGDSAGRAAHRARATLPHRETGGGGTADFGRGERTASAAGHHHQDGALGAGRRALLRGGSRAARDRVGIGARLRRS